jgi:type II secretory pathway pseudopilin PulG
MPVRQLRDESGFTMLATVIAMSVVMLLAVVAVTAVNGDAHLSRRDLDQKKAFEAAKAGIDDYAYHLSANSGYWSECTNVPTPNAVNQIGSTERRRPVPGGTGATYAVELIPATGHPNCDPASQASATESMIESGELLPGSFRIRSTGFAGEAKARLVATFKPPSFLDYVYFTQRETLDPISYGFPNPSPELTEAYAQCSLTWQQGRYEKPFKVANEGGGYSNEYCSKISFATGDVIRGPLHTNDAISINGTPTFGRTAQDLGEVGAELPGWYPLNGGSNPNFVGTFVTKAPILVPPASNSQLSAIAQPAFRFTGQVKICLNGSSMTVGNDGTCAGLYSGPIPSNGVVYVFNGACEEVYSPFTATYPETSGCGNAYVKGTYTGQLTVAAQNDVIIDGSLTRTNQTGLLGLIANNFIRLYHPCSGGSNKAGSLTSPDIDAAMLAIEHSIIVDHYNCGSPLGTISVEGALAQKFRGPVGTGTASSPSTGYLKNYVYDNRLHFQEPPSFIEPKPGNWVIGRETIG